MIRRIISSLHMCLAFFVALKLRFVTCAIWANFTSIRLLASVFSAMPIHIIRRSKCVITKITWKRFGIHFRVQFDVITKGCSPSKCLVTVVTFEWPFAGMGLLVAYQQIFISESRRRQNNKSALALCVWLMIWLSERILTLSSIFHIFPAFHRCAF